MEDQLTIDTGEITTSPGITLTSQNYVDRDKFPAKPVAKQKIGFRVRVWPLMQAYGASLVASFAIVPIVAAVFTVVLFIVMSTVPGWQSVAWGCLLAGIIWLVLSIPLAALTSAKAVNPHNYGLIENRLSRLESRLYILQTTTPEDQLKPYQRVALEEAYDNLSKLHDLMYSSTARLPWVLAMGYINAWNWLHRTEEALIEIEPVEMIVSGAYHDYMAIYNSKMDNSKDLLCNLRAAAKALDPAIASVFAVGNPALVETEALGEIDEGVNKIGQDIHRIATKLGVHLSDDDDQSAKTDKKTPSTPDKEANARVTLREIRRALNEFRDNQRLGIVHTRNQLMATIFVTGFVTYALLCTAVLPVIPTNSGPQPGRAAILAAVVFFIVGAIAGLFGTIYRQSRANTGGDDYGLSLVRLISTPLISGLAGIGGAFLYSIFLPQFASSPSNSLISIFTLNRLDLLIAAAIFGYAPNLLMRGLQSNKYVTALQSSETSKATNTSDQQNETS
jgi:MFS family permease